MHGEERFGDVREKAYGSQQRNKMHRLQGSGGCTNIEVRKSDEKTIHYFLWEQKIRFVWAEK